MGPLASRRPQGTGVRAITVGGVAGWQISLIAAGAAIVAAVAAVCLDRALTSDRAGPVIASWRCFVARTSTVPVPAVPGTLAQSSPARRPTRRGTGLPAAALRAMPGQ